MLDIGVSSHQLDDAERGFTYKDDDAPLDMRMDNRQSLTAEIVVNEYSENELFHIIRDYGEDQFAKNIAKHIVRMRNEVGRITTTGQLVEAVKAAIPMKFRGTGYSEADSFTQGKCINNCRNSGTCHGSYEETYTAS